MASIVIRGPAASARDDGPSGRILDGITAPAGEWPEVAAILDGAISDRYKAQYCGATVLNRSWVLTAAHCVWRWGATGESLGLSKTSEVDVLTGTQALSTGGVRHDSATLRVYPAFNPQTLRYDAALIRLDRPTRVNDFMQLPPSSSDPATDAVPGSGPAYAAGWGATSSYDRTCCYPDKLLFGELQMVSDSTCQRHFSSVTGVADAIHVPSMVCGTARACYGDSGGPLVGTEGSPGERVQWGIASWVLAREEPPFCTGHPAVFARLPPMVSWIKSNIRYGPHAGSAEFVKQLWLDLYGRLPTGEELFYGVAGIKATTVEAYVSSRILHPTWQNRAGGAARLYGAAFGRDADSAGLGYWIERLRTGWTLERVAEFFAGSAELQDRYGALANQGYVEQLYQNVLGRPGEPAGVAYWTAQLDTGAMTRGRVLRDFSQSSEYVAETRPHIDTMITYFGLLRRVPPSGSTIWDGKLSTIALSKLILESYSYAARF